MNEAGDGCQSREERERERDPVPGVNGRVECRGGQPDK